MLKLILGIWMLLLLTLNAQALSEDALKEIAKKNPGLINTPEAQAYLKKKKGVLKDNTQKASNKVDKTKTVIDTKPLETIKTDDTLMTRKVKEESEAKPSTRLSPLQYKGSNEELERIKAEQTPRLKHKNLERFSKEFFRNKNKISQKNITTPKDYSLARGDTLNFWIYGKTEKTFSLTINNVGNIDIPQVGPVRVAGEKFEEVKELLTNYLTSSYKNSSVVITLETFSNSQVTLTGFVNTPGIYNTTAVSSVKDILIEANGVDTVGSVRNIQIKRDNKTIQKIDYYHLLSNGLEHGDVVLQPDDTIFIPRAYGLVSIEGAVYKEALYEIEKGESLAHILKFAGGLKAAADGHSIRLKRYDENAHIQNLTLSIHEARNFIVKDGDEIYIDGLNMSHDNYVLMMGNILREGKRNMPSRGLSLSALLKEQMKDGKLSSLFLENTRFDYAMIKRIGEDMKAKIFDVNLQDILDGKSDFILHNKDELYIFNNLDTGTAPFVMIEGSPLIKAGKYLFHDGMTLLDLINQAGIKSPYDTTKVKIVSTTDKEGKATVIMINSDDNSSYPLHERDTVTLFGQDETHPLNTATISGEVVKTGKYAVSKGMSLMDFIQSAGGLNERAYPKECEIIRYTIKDGERQKKTFTLSLSEASSFLIQQHDEINIKRIPYWNERKTINLTGEVKFPGSYVVSSGEKLSSVIKRAGGFTKEAFLYGATFTRDSVQKLQAKSMQKELARLKEQSILINVRNSSDSSMISNARYGKTSDIKETLTAVDSLIKAAKDVQPQGRIVIDLKDTMATFEGSDSDLVLKDKDALHIPAFNDTVIVNGEVMMPTALTYQGEDIQSYIERSGGLTHFSDVEHVYVVHANGEARKATLGSFLFSSGDVDIRKGDVIVVPKQFYIDTRNISFIKDISDIFYKLSLTVAAAHTVGAL